MPQETIERVDTYPVWVDYHHMGPDPKGYDSATGSGAETLDGAHLELEKQIRYYQDLGCQVTRAYIDRACSHCNGTGKINKYPKTRRGRVRAIRCPACKGKEPTVRVETWIDLPKPMFRYGPNLYRYDVFPDYKEWEATHRD